MSSLRDRMTKGLAITFTADDEAAAASMKPTAPTTGPGQTMQIVALRKQLEEAKSELAAVKDGSATQAKIKELEEQLATASMLEIPLVKLHEVKGRRRYMPPEKYAELRDNLRHNKLTHPVVVHPREDGDYDIISGHHRTDAYRELGRETIRCVLEDGTEDEAEDAAFWANLMQSDLTDYEKYVGLKRFQDKHPELNQTQLADRVGISQPHVSNLLSFGRLPEEALAILDTHKAIIGARSVKDLSTLAEAGKGSAVVEAIRQLADKKLDQSQAVRFVRDSDKPKVTKAPADSFKVKTGKATWCDVRRARNVMRIEFQSEDIAQGAQEAIREYLEKLASASKI